MDRMEWMALSSRAVHGRAAYFLSSAVSQASPCRSCRVLLRQDDLDACLGKLQPQAGWKRIVRDQALHHRERRDLDARLGPETCMICQHDYLARRVDHRLLHGDFR